MKEEKKNTTMTTPQNVSLFNHIRKAAKVLRDSGLTDEVLNHDELGIVREMLKLADNKEAAVIVIMASESNDHTVDTNDISQFLRCSEFDAMTLSAALKSLTEKGFITIDENALFPKPQYEFADDILEAIVENREVRPHPIIVSTHYDQFNLCRDVHKLLCDRKQNKITTDALFANVTSLEDNHRDLEFVRKLKEELNEVKHRIITYDLCCKFAVGKGEELDMRSVLAAIYSGPMQAAIEQAALRKKHHPLLEHGFVTINEDKIHMDDHLLRLLYGDAADAYIDNVEVDDRYAFVAAINNVFSNRRFGREKSVFDKANEAHKTESGNGQLTMVKGLKVRGLEWSARLVFYILCAYRLQNEDFEISELNEIFVVGLAMNYRRAFMEGRHPLLASGLVKVRPEEMAENAVLQLTEAGEALFFEEDLELFEQPLTGSDIIQADSIGEKKLFFDDELQKQLSLLGQSMHEDKYQQLIKRLADKHMSTGVCALLYGHPGTGKTESVMQLARETGRAVMHVDISQTKSCWFGESEKMIKSVFARYRRLCKKSKLKPILLFNEADGVLAKRKDTRSSNVSQTENAMQNIILEEMERLDGIMIATTNLANNLDSAFERRFLFKVRFDAPTVEAKTQIWMSKLPRLTKSEASVLASRFAFSGGEIDNVVRKAEMEELLSGEPSTMESIIDLCTKEKMGSERRAIGFA